MTGHDPYFSRREQQERARADTSADPAIRAIHLDLADRYAALHDREAEPTTLAEVPRGERTRP